MSKRRFGGSSGTYNVRASELAREKQRKTIRCTVFFLDDSQQGFELDKRTKGHTLLEMVFDHLELIEKDYFGLQFADLAPAPDAMRWLDPNKSIKKQIRTGEPYLLYFRVKFYVSDPSKLQEEYTRYHIFLQLKKDILEGRLLVSESSAALLASYAVQSELGDYNKEEHTDGYLSEFRFVPNQTEELERKIMEFHKLHKGQTPADAEYNFLDHAKRLDMYGVDLHRARVRDSSNAEIQLGVTSNGLVVFQNNIKINTFSWAKIVKISFKRKQFFIQLRREGRENVDSLIGFNMVSYRSCKNLWKCCVENHTFFRLHVPKPPPRSGRTEHQTVEDGKRRARMERTFLRSPSKRYARRTVAGIPRDGILEERTYENLRNVPVKPARMNGTHIRAYDSFNNKVQAARINDYKPRKAWSDGNQSDDDGGFLHARDAFTPAIPPKMISYMDDDHSCTEQSFELPSYIEHVPNGVGGDGLVAIRMKPDDQGRFGFNVKGGADQNMPIIVSRVAPNTPADLCLPRLNEGDQVLLINGRDVSQYTHEQVVRFIRASRESHTKELVLTIRPNVYISENVEEPDFQYIPISPHVVTRVPGCDALSESVLLMSESLESGAAVAQFEQLYRKKPGMTMSAARLPENIIKNRYRDISPYDNTRVVLQGGTSGDFINASFVNMEIPTSGIINRYIAAQGPLATTCADFWQMVWEQQSTLVVMLTTKIERGRVKCHQYWPDLYETIDYGMLQVTCLKEEETPSFAFREFTLINMENNEERHISHMQYIAWPDHGVPDESTDFLNFVLRVRQNRIGMVEPTVVHCSAGIGRTGVLILMETAMCLMEANEPVYPLDIVRFMRDQRAMLIQTMSQYKFVCEAILRVFNEGLIKPLQEYQR